MYEVVKNPAQTRPKHSLFHTITKNLRNCNFFGFGFFSLILLNFVCHWNRSPANYLGFLVTWETTASVLWVVLALDEASTNKINHVKITDKGSDSGQKGQGPRRQAATRAVRDDNGGVALRFSSWRGLTNSRTG